MLNRCMQNRKEETQKILKEMQKKQKENEKKEDKKIEKRIEDNENKKQTIETNFERTRKNKKPEKEEMVMRFNKMLSENAHLFHAVYDQASLCVNPEKPNCSRKEYLGKDYIHPNKTGGKIVADNVNLEWFR